MRYFVKNIRNATCRNTVTKHFDDFNVSVRWVQPGMIELLESIAAEKESYLKKALKKSGYILQKDKKSLLADEVKLLIAKMLASKSEMSVIKFSRYLSEELGYHYTYIINVFSEVQGLSIKQYIINEKIEVIKNMMANEDLNLKQIAAAMQYKRVSHLSHQFKKVTGMSPSYFAKQLKNS